MKQFFKNLTTFHYIFSLSFSYGIYRGFTTPFYFISNKKNNDIILVRGAFCFATGIKYITPPFCFFAYIDLYKRLKNKYYNLENNIENNVESYKEWGIYNPRII